MSKTHIPSSGQSRFHNTRSLITFFKQSSKGPHILKGGELQLGEFFLLREISCHAFTLGTSSSGVSLVRTPGPSFSHF